MGGRRITRRRGGSFSLSRGSGIFDKFGLPRSAVSSEADEQGDGEAKGWQLEANEEDCKVFGP